MVREGALPQAWGWRRGRPAPGTGRRRASWPCSGGRSRRQAFPLPSSPDTRPHVCVGPGEGGWGVTGGARCAPGGADPVGRAGAGRFREVRSPSAACAWRSGRGRGWPPEHLPTWLSRSWRGGLAPRQRVCNESQLSAGATGAAQRDAPAARAIPAAMDLSCRKDRRNERRQEPCSGAGSWCRRRGQCARS